MGSDGRRRCGGGDERVRVRQDNNRKKGDIGLLGSKTPKKKKKCG